jgi:hypothetical protein
MTAKEAREKALWNKLPEVIRTTITQCVDNGFMESVSVNRDEALEQVHYSVNIPQTLTDLGYDVRISGEYYVIRW